VTAEKREGDGATPLGRFAMRSCYWRPDRGPRPKTGLPTIPIRRDLGWCDDPSHPLYNRPVRLPFAGSYERMWREDRAYDVVVVLDQNLSPAVPGGGSAVFWHLTKGEALTPTEGCVAVAPEEMRRLLPLCRAGTVLEVAEG
jgi:L,D-peptidoglycan transpeptidase YkuD (ErfK/YbiS/YcfS/YnhG family)